MQRNREQSPLLKLPAELRILIYEYVLSDSTYEIEFDRNTGLHSSHREGPKTHLPLVCRQLNTDTALLRYAFITFSFSRIKVVNIFLKKCTSAQIKMIKTLELRTAGGDDFMVDTLWMSADKFRFLQRMQGLEKIEVAGPSYKYMIGPVLEKLGRRLRVWKPEIEYMLFKNLGAADEDELIDKLEDF